MGNSETIPNLQKIPFPKGMISIELNKNKYCAGEKIVGIVFLTLNENFPSQILAISIKGTEKALIFPNTSEIKLTQKDKMKYGTKRIFMFTEHLINSKYFNLFPKGEYSYKFELTLNENTIPTFKHACKNKKYLQSASVEYKIIAGLFDIKNGYFLKAKSMFHVYTSKTTLDGSNKTAVMHEFGGFQIIGKPKTIRMEVKSREFGLSADDDNQILINIDARNAHSSPTNLKIQLLHVLKIKYKKLASKCENVIWEKLIAQKLPKGINYSGNNGFLVILPASVTNHLFESVKSKTIESDYFIRLVFGKSKSNAFTNFSDRHFELIHYFQLIRTHEPRFTDLIATCQNSSSWDTSVNETFWNGRHRGSRNSVNTLNLNLNTDERGGRAISANPFDRRTHKAFQIRNTIENDTSDYARHRNSSQNTKKHAGSLEDSSIPIITIQLENQNRDCEQSQNFNYPVFESEEEKISSFKF